eukprot:3464046-Rhodomonas_salina.4
MNDPANDPPKRGGFLSFCLNAFGPMIGLGEIRGAFGTIRGLGWWSSCQSRASDGITSIVARWSPLSGPDVSWDTILGWRR